MTKDEARKELLETLEEYCHDKGYNLQVFAGMAKTGGKIGKTK